MEKNNRSCLWVPSTRWRVPGTGFHFSVMPRHRKSGNWDLGPIRGTRDPGSSTWDPLPGTRDAGSCMWDSIQGTTTWDQSKKTYFDQQSTIFLYCFKFNLQLGVQQPVSYYCKMILNKHVLMFLVLNHLMLKIQLILKRENK